MNTYTKFQLYCSCIYCKLPTTAQNINAHYKSKHVPKTPQPHGNCLQCGIELVSKYSSKFCSRSCSAIYHNSRKDYTIIKPGPKKGSVNSKYLPYTRIKQCPVCDKYHPRSGASCSPACASIIISNKMKARIYNGFNPNTNRGRGKQSYLESSFCNWLAEVFPSLKYTAEYPIRRLDSIKTYFADFYFPDKQLIIELDGTQHKYTADYDRDRDSYITATYGIRVIRISHDEYLKKSKMQFIINEMQDH